MSNNTVCAEYLLFYWESGIVVYARKRLSTWPVPSKNLGHGISNKFIRHFTCVVTTPCEGTKHVLYNSTENRLLKVCPWFPLEFTLWNFSLCWFCFFSFYYKKKNLIHEYVYMLRLVSPLKSSNLGSLGSTTHYLFLLCCTGISNSYFLFCLQLA